MSKCEVSGIHGKVVAVRVVIGAVVFGLLTGCASPATNKGSVFKANELEGEAFAAGVTGR